MEVRSIKWMLILLAFFGKWEKSQGHDDCHRYQVFNDRSRAASVPRGNTLRCDQRDISHTQWYRFTGASGTQMPTKCVPTHRCGTHAPGWLSTPHPTRTGQIVNGKVCFHWSGNCCRWSANIQIKMCNGYYIYKLGKTPVCWLRYCGDAGFGDDGCSNHQVLNDRTRSASVHRGNILRCDQRDLPVTKWYRFTGASGTMMPTSCVPRHYCGTHAPGWLSGSHPTSVGQTVNAKVCFNWGANCCTWNVNIQIKKCNGFYVYKLVRTPVCWLRYCGNAGFDKCKLSNPCKNGATCTPTNDGYTCRCRPGYHGRNCEHDINECNASPCRNGGTCVNLPGSYRCTCRPGFTGRHCETVLDPCVHFEELKDRQRAASVHRGNTLKCDQKDFVATPKWYRFTGAAGTQMPTSCVPKHYCGTHAPGWLSGSHPTRVGQVVNGKVCFHWSSSCCTWHATIQIKKCSGFYVYKLPRTPVCWLRYCGNAGFDPCRTSRPCQNGATCINNNGDYTCQCRPGFQGKDCEQDINECTSRPCRNGGTCENLSGSYRCKCRPGFLGNHCEIVFDECRHYETLSDRERAAGIHRGNTLKCDQKDLETPKWYRFTGAAGTQMPTSCVPQHYCGTHAPGWVSTQHPTRVGQIVNGKVCFHWSRSCCNWYANIQIKKCNGFFVYKLVRTPLCWLRYCGNAGFDACKVNKPCKNGATCVAQQGGYSCLCTPGFLGKNCDQDVNECLTRPCLNGGTCQNLHGSYSCKCKPGFLGKHCERAIDGCVDYMVLNENNRAAGYSGNFVQCDQSALKTPAWYRFTGDAGDKIADSCVAQSHCGTHAPGWLSGAHPVNVGETVERQVCFHWGSSYCKWSVKIKVKKCSSYFVYELQRTPVCHLRYCGNAGLAVNECTILKPCKNGATCFDMPIGYRCQCASGFQGKNCSQDINECVTNNPCKNGATCENSIGGYTCRCAIGFKGKNCDQDVNECINSPCRNGGTCVNLNGSYRCDCAQGFTGRHCEQDVDECSVNPCQNGATCVNNVGAYQCLCAPGYTGQHCDGDVDECQNSPCQNGGSCINLKGSYQCNCTKGFTGRHCEQDVNECSTSNPCKNGATCVNNVGGYQCLCVPGYTGIHCDTDVDECQNSPCQNGGTCVNLKGSYRCDCTQGFTGKHCQQDVDECFSVQPCQNGGTCVNKPGGYDCQCASGFNGKDCQSDVDECQNNPCQNGGSCVNLRGSYRCNCVQGFTGKHCNQDIDECQNRPCMNGATCANKPGSYECNCTSGYKGRHCENDIDECLNNPCRNGGTCNNTLGGYVCKCHTGFNGKDCENDVDECQSNPCVNGGNCTNKRGGFDCSCPSGFTGKTCGQDVDECRNSPCKNGGTCTNQIGTYKCDCLPGYEGKHCDQDVDECTKRNPCKNGATCINLIGGFECRCPAGYHGEVCDQDINECLNNPCQNTGNCINTVGGYNCQCIQGFEGKDCENDTNECKILGPCQNGGTCQNVVGTYKCVCPDGYTGFNCEIRKNFQALGCFSDTVNDRAMDKLLFNFRGQIDWRDMSKTVKNCSEAARKQPRQYTYFAIQYYGECWGALAGTKYDKHGRASDDKCWSGVGGSLTNFVYRLF